MIRFSCNRCRVQGVVGQRRRWFADPFFGDPYGMFGNAAGDPFGAGLGAGFDDDFDDGFDPIGVGYSGFSRYTARYNRRFY